MTIEERIVTLFGINETLTAEQIRNRLALQLGQPARQSTVGVCLSRLVSDAKLKRVSRGIYALPGWKLTEEKGMKGYVLEQLAKLPDAWFRVEHLVEKRIKAYGSGFASESEIRSAVEQLLAEKKIAGDLAMFQHKPAPTPTPRINPSSELDEILS
jgi:hypothetical protein